MQRDLQGGVISAGPEETWSSARLRDVPPVPVTPPARPPHGSPASPAPLPAPPAVSATATACPGRGRDGRVPSPGASFRGPRPLPVPRRAGDEQVLVGGEAAAGGSLVGAGG